jgi:hypothetical protein
LISLQLINQSLTSISQPCNHWGSVVRTLGCSNPMSFQLGYCGFKQIDKILLLQADFARFLVAFHPLVFVFYQSTHSQFTYSILETCTDRWVIVAFTGKHFPSCTDDFTFTGTLSFFERSIQVSICEVPVSSQCLVTLSQNYVIWYVSMYDCPVYLILADTGNTLGFGSGKLEAKLLAFV